MTLEEIKAALQEIIDKLESAEDLSDDEIKELEDKANQLEEEKKSLIEKTEKRNATLEKIKKGVIGRSVETVNEEGKEEKNMNQNAEFRSAYLKKLRGLQLTEKEERAFAISGVNGAMPVETSTEIIKKLKDQAPLLKEITLLNVAGSVKFAVEGTKTSGATHTENATITGDGDTLVTVTLNGYEVTKLVQVSKSVATMTNDAFEAWLTDMIAEMLADKIITLIIKGNGSSEAKGIEKANTWGDTNSVTVGKTATLSEVNVQKLMSLLKAGYSKNAKYLMNNATLFNDFMPLQNLAKNSIVTESNGVYYIYGKEVLLSEDVADHEAYFGNLKKYVGNLAEDVNIVGQFDVDTNSYKFLGSAIFDGQPALGEAFVKLVKATA